MTTPSRWHALALVLAAGLGCGDDDHHISPPPGGDGGPGGVDGGGGPDASGGGGDGGGSFDDTSPPAIEINTPSPGEIVGGVIGVSATVMDPSGVEDGSVVAVFHNGLDMLAEAQLEFVGGNWIGGFDARMIRHAVETLYGPGAAVVFPTLSVRARDLVGNEGSLGIEVVLDYTAPIASLDPPPLREMRFNSDTGVFECSLEFDPLGDDASNDGQRVAQLAEFRARIEDRGNWAPSTSGVVLYAAGVKEASAQLFVLGGATTNGVRGDALVIDSDGDGVCDDINPAVKPGPTPDSSHAVVVNLVGIKPDGVSLFSDDDYSGYATCGPPDSSDTEIPPALCPLSSGIQRVIKPVIGDEPVIYGIPPLDDFSCMGLPFDLLANNIPEGWLCLAIRVEDAVGNAAVSRPIRVCYDRDNDGAEGCPPMPTYPATPDMTFDVTDVPNVPTVNPPVDCLGAFKGGVTNPSATCTLPPNFPPFEEHRIDIE